MTKKELVKQIASELKISQGVVSKVLNSFFSNLEKVVKKGDTLSIVGYLTIGVKQRSARTAFNPKTKQKVNIPAKKVPYIKIGSKLKKSV